MNWITEMNERVASILTEKPKDWDKWSERRRRTYMANHPFAKISSGSGSGETGDVKAPDDQQQEKPKRPKKLKGVNAVKQFVKFENVAKKHAHKYQSSPDKESYHASIDQHMPDEAKSSPQMQKLWRAATGSAAEAENMHRFSSNSKGAHWSKQLHKETKHEYRDSTENALDRMRDKYGE